MSNSWRRLSIRIRTNSKISAKSCHGTEIWAAVWPNCLVRISALWESWRNSRANTFLTWRTRRTRFSDWTWISANWKKKSRWSHQKLDSQKREFDAQVETNVLLNFSENVLMGKIYMAVENLFSKCHELNRRIKRGKSENTVDNVNQFGRKVSSRKETSQRGLHIENQQEKLNFIMNCLKDFSQISNKFKNA